MPNADPRPPRTTAVAAASLTRRQGLLALALLAPAGLLAACNGSTEPPAPSSSASGPPPDLAAEVAAEESALVAAYDSVLAGPASLDPQATALLTLLRDQHSQHRDALGGAATEVTAPAPPESTTAALAGLIAAERAAARSRLRACVAAGDAELARLLTFIGASEASHVPALRDLGSGA